LVLGSSKRHCAASGRRGGLLQSATPPASAGLVQSATAAAPASPAAAGLGAPRLSVPPSSAGLDEVTGSVPVQGASDGGFSVDYIEQLLQQELTAAMLEELGG
jgi:hypothetical protein